MMIKGSATFKRYLANPDNTPGMLLEEGIVGDNIINKRVITELLTNFSATGVFEEALKIATSQQVAAENFEVETLLQINSVGDPTLVATPYLYTDRDGVNPSQIVYTNRFLPPASTRTINTIAIVQGATLVDDPSATTTRNSYTQLLLGVPLTQQDNEILDISYKIFTDWQGSPFQANIAYQRKVEWRLFDRDNLNGTFGDGNTFNISASWFPSKFSYWPDKTQDAFCAYRRFGAGLNGITMSNDPPPFGTENPAYGDIEYGRWVNFYGEISGDDFLTANILGRMSRAILFGEPRPGNYDNVFYTTGVSQWPGQDFGTPSHLNDWGAEVLWNKNSNLSTLWSHEALATSWMYDVNGLANSSWQPAITESSVVTDFPTAYYLRVTTAGGLGVGEYKLFKDSFGDYDNNYIDTQFRGDAIWTIGGESPYTQDPTNEEIIWNHRWVYNWEKTQDSFKYATFRRDAGVALWDLTSESHTEINTFPLSIFTQFGSRINDIDVYPVGNIIYVACETGLYEITSADTSPVVNQLSADACASVTVGSGGQPYAIFRDGLGSGRLAAGPSWSTALDVSGSSINWDNVWRIFIDPDSANFDLMIYEGPVAKHDLYINTASLPHVGIYNVHWWNNVSNWIQTDSFDHVVSLWNTSWNTGNYVSQELMVLPSNHAVQVTNGVWVYPGDIRVTGDVLERITNPSPAYINYMSNSTTSDISSLPLDTLIEFVGPGATRGFRAKGNTVIGYNLGITEIHLGNNYYYMGGSKDYLFGFHATAPFHTEPLDGTIGELLLGKPSPGATTYDLAWFQSFNYPKNEVTVTVPTDDERKAHKYKLSVDEGGVSTLTDYSALSLRHHYTRMNNDFYWYLSHANFVIGVDKRVFWFASPQIAGIDYGDFSGPEPDDQGRVRRQVAHHDGGIGLMPILRDTEPGGDFDDSLMQAYEWTGAAWIPDTTADNTGPGKPIHTGTEALIDGLSIDWTDLQPGNSQDLIVDQWYNFVKITEPTTILAETTSPNISGFAEIYYRRLISTFDSGTIPVGLTITLPEAPTGSAPDALWLSLPPDRVGRGFSATINGVEVPIFVNAGTPPAGQIYITDPAAGTLEFNAVDNGLSYTINYFYIHKYHSSEVL